MTPPTPSLFSLPFQPDTSLDITQALTHADDLLRCACVVAYENADQQKGEARHLALTVVHLVGMARSLVVHGLETDTSKADGEVVEGDG